MSTFNFLFQLHHTLQQRAQKRGSFVLTMDQISTKLASLKMTRIPMPGINTKQQVVIISLDWTLVCGIVIL